MSKRVPKLEVYKSGGGFYELAPARWRWRLVGGNGEIQCPSEGYTRRQDAVRGAQTAQRNMALAEIVFSDD